MDRNPTGAPTGTVTFLFTDIEGSSTLARTYPREILGLLKRHHAILRETLTEQGGYVFEVIGDAFCAAFHTAETAVQAAVAVQRRLRQETWDPAPIRVRVGIHTGPATSGSVEGREGYTGYLTLARVQRAMSKAYGGQVLLSNAGAEMARQALPDGVSLRDLGEHRLKGIPGPERLWQVCAPGLQTDFPALAAANETPNNLPLQLSSFIGREREIAEAESLLGRSRLLTLTGPGGTGKSRLALQAAGGLLDEFTDGVWLVELAPLSDPALVIKITAAVLGVREAPAGELQGEVTNYLSGKHALLVLDNCEHLIEAAAGLVEALLGACPKLHVLASSREALDIPGEVVLPVPPLALPNGGDPAHSEAVQLFFERARAVQPDFACAEEAAGCLPATADICRRLDGIPLAIELAAARVKMLSPEQILSRLDDRFRLLTGGGRTVVPRHRTLQAAIEWSFDLLSQDERRLFRRLAVFSGGWTLEAAERVCSYDGLHEMNVLDLLSALVNKSLVVVRRESSAEPRYYLLETIRVFAAEKLAEAGESQALAGRYLEYYLAWSEEIARRIVSSDQRQALARYRADQDNLRRALSVGLEQRPPALSGLRLAIHLGIAWEIAGQSMEGLDWLHAYLDAAGGEFPAADHALALARTAWLHAILHEYEMAYQAADASLRLQPSGQSAALALLARGRTASAEGVKELPELIALAGQAQAEARRAGERQLEVRATTLMGVCSLFYGQPVQALAYFDTARRLNEPLRERYLFAEHLAIVAMTRLDYGDVAEARRLTEERLAITRERGIEWFVSHDGWMLMACGDYPTAEVYFNDFHAYWMDRGRWENLMGLDGLVLCKLLQDQVDEARRLLAEMLDLWNHQPIRPDRREAARLFYEVNLGTIYVLLGESEPAHRYLDAIDESLLGEYSTSEVNLALARLALKDDDRPAVRSHLERCLRVFVRVQRRILAVEAVELAARLFARLGRPEPAAGWLGAARAFRKQAGLALPPLFQPEMAQLEASLQAALGPAAYKQRYAAGQARSLDEAAEDALRQLEQEAGA